jgi:Zn finger protein HypA/HybF involved in hydrogenase expression
MNKKIELQTLKCKRCQHRWTPRKPVVYLCPKCKSPKWDVPK